MSASPADPDPLRRLLDAVLEREHTTVEDMAGGAFVSPFHFGRQVREGSGESPRALRRRVELERAAWSLAHGTSVTDAAFAAGYDSVEGFSRAFHRAFGYPPSRVPADVDRGHWLPAPNGIHFHSPVSLYVDAEASAPAGPVMLQVQHDAADVDLLLETAAQVSEQEYRAVRLPGAAPRTFDGPEESLAEVMRHLVLSKEPWLASIAGEKAPAPIEADELAALAERHRRISARWLAMVRDVDRRGAWADSIIDALCDPPESFTFTEIITEELTFSAHRRLVARWMLARAGVDVGIPDLDPSPILWNRRRRMAHDRHQREPGNPS
jgi:AraC-like DNA-binding protein